MSIFIAELLILSTKFVRTQESKKFVSFIMFKTYILRSVKDGSYYYGHTSSMAARLDYHNKGRVKSTKAKRPWRVFYFEEYATKSEAYRREMFFKSIDGYNFLRESGIIKPTESWQSGRMRRSWKPLYLAVPGVRIPHSLQTDKALTFCVRAFFMSKRSSLLDGA